ncbi:MAG: hypothetical protein KatS3mg122_0629 [Caldimonas sp.]|nr:MAG: hypothetical protein KatS3mg122_0629 [Caldimonas sp.]
MLEPLAQLLGPAVLDRLTLALNHLLAAEPVATRRLAPQAGRRVRLILRGWPALLPPAPPVCWEITRAGLLERVEAAGDAPGVLDLVVDASNPVRLAAQWVAGDRSSVSLQGDAELAATLAWLMDHLRWDVEEDLSRLMGDVAARQAATVLRALGAAVRAALKAMAPLAARMDGGANRPGHTG